uniref:Uncharacterized protein n=1 Tax=Octopus bimaculoides TaxID=37653 RepID=A0A0L8G2L6_OCTBM
MIAGDDFFPHLHFLAGKYLKIKGILKFKVIVILYFVLMILFTFLFTTMKKYFLFSF